MTSILRNKNCLITGASGGLGSALARQLAKSGCNLFLVGRNTEKLLQLSKEILEKFSEISVCYSLCDLSNAEEINESASEANDKFGSIDILINSAGTFPVGDVIDMSADDFNYCFDVNVRAPFQLSKLLFLE